MDRSQVAGCPREARRRGVADLHHPARHALRRHLHGDRAGASVRRAADHARAGRGGPGVLPAVGPQERPRPHRPGQGKDRRVHRLVRHQSGQRRGDSDLGGRLRADQLRHRARSWPCRPTTPATSSSPSSSICRSSRWSIRGEWSVAERSGESERWHGRTAAAPRSAPPAPIPNPPAAFIADGVAINSGPYNGLSTPEFKQKIAEDLAAGGIGRAAVNYKLRDWLFSRQHFWGEPFPILHELDAAGKPTGRIRAAEARGFAAGPAGGDGLRRRRTTSRRRRWTRPRTIGSTSRSTASGTSARRTRCRNGPARAGTICGSSIRRTTRRWSIRRSRRRGCRSICTSAGRSTPCCTCSTPASGTRCSSTAAT